MKRRTETSDVYFLHLEVLETHLAWVWVVGGYTVANSDSEMVLFFSLLSANTPQPDILKYKSKNWRFTKAE